MTNAVLQICDNCFEEYLMDEDAWTKAHVYETPWEKEPTEKHFCSTECRDLYLYADDFRYFVCVSCLREICEQNPANGWHMQFRWVVPDEQICLKCYEEEVLEYGQPRFEFEEEPEQITNGAFLSIDDLIDAGFEEDGAYFVRRTSDAEQLNQRALDLKKDDYLVLIQYKSMAIGGLEGHVKLWRKKTDD